MAEDAVLHIIDRGRVRHLVLNRPAARNALDARLMGALTGALGEAEAAPHVGAVLLRGAGAGFCAGADLKETAALADESAIRAHADRLRRLLLAPSRLSKPVVVQVHGFALGAGCALALACDAAFATPASRFGYPEARHAILPALVVPGLVRRLGRAAAFDLLLTGRIFDGTEAEARGVARLVEESILAEAADAYAAELAASPPGFAGAVKALIEAVDDVPLDEGMEHAVTANVRSRLARLGLLPAGEAGRSP